MYTDIYSLDNIIIAVVNLKLHSASNVDYSSVDVEEKKTEYAAGVEFQNGLCLDNRRKTVAEITSP